MLETFLLKMSCSPEWWTKAGVIVRIPSEDREALSISCVMFG